jgi:heterodisulfide reductase subunit C
MTVESARARLTSTEDACIECGLCTDSCDVIGERRLTIGQVASRLLAGETSGEVVDAVVRCSMCGFWFECPVDIDVRATAGCQGAPGFGGVPLAVVYDGC